MYYCQNTSSNFSMDDKKNNGEYPLYKKKDYSPFIFFGDKMTIYSFF